MRYILLDHAEETIYVDDGKGGQKAVKVNLKQILEENCWGAPEWRQDEAWLAAWERLSDVFEVAFNARAPYVGADDKDYEKFCPIATLKGKQLPMHLSRPITRLTACILRASSKEPEQKPANGVEAPQLSAAVQAS